MFMPQHPVYMKLGINKTAERSGFKCTSSLVLIPVSVGRRDGLDWAGSPLRLFYVTTLCQNE